MNDPRAVELLSAWVRALAAATGRRGDVLTDKQERDLARTTRALVKDLWERPQLLCKVEGCSHASPALCRATLMAAAGIEAYDETAAAQLGAVLLLAPIRGAFRSAIEQALVHGRQAATPPQRARVPRAARRRRS